MSRLFRRAVVRDDPEMQARILSWAERLESGREKQGTGRLKWGDEFCCLGVLCLEAGEQFGRFQDDAFLTVGQDERFVGCPPLAVTDHFGLANSEGAYDAVVDGRRSTSLVADNDGDHHDFQTIAATIRRELQEILES